MRIEGLLFFCKRCHSNLVGTSIFHIPDGIPIPEFYFALKVWGKSTGRSVDFHSRLAWLAKSSLRAFLYIEVSVAGIGRVT